MQNARMTTPSSPLLQGRPYTLAAHTNVLRTWLRHGWTPPSREAQEQVKNRLNPQESSHAE